MPRRTMRGKPRKAGPAKKGFGQAAAKRYHRAVTVLLNDEDKFGWRQFKDIHEYYNYKVAAYGAGNVKAGTKLEKCGSMLKQAYYMMKDRKLVKEIKRNQKAKSKKKGETPKSLAKQYKEIVEQLREAGSGSVIGGFTIVPSKGAKNNPALIHLLDLDKGESLCQERK